MSDGCVISDCCRPVKTKGMCGSHYQQQRRTGNPIRKQFAMEWLIAQKNWRGDECLIWPFSAKDTGYGQVLCEGVNVLAHRAMCREAHGEPPTPDHEAAHSCGVQQCVNPNHLRWATPVENAADRKLHGTHYEGGRHPGAAFTDEIASIIRRDQRVGSKIAAEYGVVTSTINHIRQGRTYKTAIGGA